MRLKKITLSNFRCFELLTVNFDKQLTVLVANNGMGKTTVLDAIAIGLGAFLSVIPNVPTRNPKETDFRVMDNGRKPPYMRIQLSTWDDVSWDRNSNRDKTKSTSGQVPSSIGQKAIRQYAVDRLNGWFNRNEADLPIIAYYGTGRAVFDTPQKRRNFQKDFAINDAYAGALDAKANFKRFFEYFYFLEDLERREQQEQKEWAFELYELSVIRMAISRMMPGFSKPHSKIRPLRFLVDWDHEGRKQQLRIEQLSDGYRTTLAMVMDIASRLAGLHPSSDDALNGSGIVLIDEVELHLHPSWQQAILPDLMRTFPNVQFIVSTHSPQVLSTVRRENIRVIEQLSDGGAVAEPPLAMSYGEPSGDVLQSVMMVDPQPPVSEKADLERLTEWVDQGGYETDDAKTVMQNLRNSLGENHPQIQRLERSIRRQEALKK